MNIQVMSDLHLEFRPDWGEKWIDGLDTKGVDVLCLVGDVALHKKLGEPMLIPLLERFCTRFANVVYVAGNHEFYQSNRPSVISDLVEMCARVTNFHWLEDSTTLINGQRFIGSTLWFPYSNDKKGELSFNDFRQIKDLTKWVYDKNSESIIYLTKNVQAGDIVLTHHIPTIEGVASRWRGDPLNRFFLSQMPGSVLGCPRFWFYGHTHDSMRFTKGECEFVCNPYGYWNREVNRGFDKKLVMQGANPLCSKCSGTGLVWVPLAECFDFCATCCPSPAPTREVWEDCSWCDGQGCEDCYGEGGWYND